MTPATSDPLPVSVVVLDASAAVEIVLWTALGGGLAAHVAEAADVVVPDHFHLECAAALRRLELRGEVAPEVASAALEQVLTLRVRRVDTRPLLREAWSLRANVTMADALYVVLARRLGAPLVTGDVRLTKAPKLGIEVLLHDSPTATASEPGEPSGPAERSARERIEVFTRVYLHSGWSRRLPEGAVTVLSALVDQPLTREEIHQQLRTATPDRLGLRADAWDPLHRWTDEELATQRAEFAGTPFEASDSEPSTAAEVNAEEADLRRQRLAEVDRYAAAVGVAPVRTLAEVVDLMVACRVLLVDEAGRFEVNAAAPLPAEVLPLGVEETAREDRLRWSNMHDGTAQAIIRLFGPDGAQRGQLRTSLRDLADQVGADVESVRAGLTNLLNDGDFSSTGDVDTAEADDPIELAVSWERFARTRFGVSTAPPSGDATPTHE